MTQETGFTQTLSRRRLLLRGESLVSSIGLALAAILLATIGLAGWWTMRGQQEAWRTVRSEQIRVLCDVLSRSAESMLADGDLSSLRLLLIDAKQQHKLENCRIVLPNGQTIADTDPSRITLVSLPQTGWPKGTLDGQAKDAPADNGESRNQIVLQEPLLVRGRGGATLMISGSADPVGGKLWEAIAGIGMIGAAGLCAILFVYRRMRTRMATLGLIRDSLLACAASAPGTPRDALALRATDSSGPEAEAWNKLLEENDALRKASVAERVRESLGGPRRDGTRNDLEHACDALSVGMLIVDASGIVKHANGAAAALLQARREQVVDRPVGELFDDPATRETIAPIFKTMTGAGQRKTAEIRRPEDKGGGILRVHVRPLRRDDAGGALVTIEDVTQQRVADAARNSFVAQATHELRTPLTNMRLCLEDALDQGSESADAASLREHLNLLNHETRRLERMVGEMLSVAEIEAGSMQLNRDDVRLEKLFDELVADYKPQAAEKSITLLYEPPPKFPVIQGDRDKLVVSLHNLIGNALKYTPAGGKVTIAVRNDEKGTTLLVDVLDTGLGIAPEEQTKIFDKFYRSKDPRVGKITGTGLGLALAREIARLHGGDIAVQSELDKGSTFTLSLPVAETPAAAGTASTNKSRAA